MIWSLRQLRQEAEKSRVTLNTSPAMSYSSNRNSFRHPIFTTNTHILPTILCWLRISTTRKYFCAEASTLIFSILVTKLSYIVSITILWTLKYPWMGLKGFLMPKPTCSGWSLKNFSIWIGKDTRTWESFFRWESCRMFMSLEVWGRISKRWLIAKSIASIKVNFDLTQKNGLKLHLWPFQDQQGFLLSSKVKYTYLVDIPAKRKGPKRFRFMIR